VKHWHSLSRKRTLLVVAGALLFTLLLLAAYGATHVAELTRERHRSRVLDLLKEHSTIATPHGSVLRFAGGPSDAQADTPSRAMPLVLVHGFGADAGNWGRVVPALVRQRRIVVLELPGHGHAAPFSPPLTGRELQAGLENGLRGVEAPFVLLGNSMGGALAAHYAFLHPERVAQLILVNSSGGSWAKLKREELLPSNRAQMRRKLHILLASHAPDPPELVLDQILTEGQDPRLTSLWEDGKNGPFFDDELPALTMPVALVWGTPDEYFPVAGYLDRLREKLPKASLQLLEGCAHVPQVACPEQLVRTIEAIAKR
jgi:pimeloyl-ACP methyl ester carboxylesterase